MQGGDGEAEDICRVTQHMVAEISGFRRKRRYGRREIGEKSRTGFSQVDCDGRGGAWVPA